MVALSKGTRTDVSQREQAILAQIARIKEDIDAILRTLAALDGAQVPESLFHFHIAPKSLGSGKRVAINVRGEFCIDMDQLQNRIRQSQSQLLALRHKYPFLVYDVLRKEAVAQQSRFRTETQRELARDAKQTGGVDDKSLRRLARRGEGVLRRFVTLLNAQPTRENMKAVLDAMKDPLLLGGSMDAGASAEAFKALRRASVKRLRRARDTYNGNSNRANADALFKAAADAYFFGASSTVVDPMLEGVPTQ